MTKRLEPACQMSKRRGGQEAEMMFEQTQNETRIFILVLLLEPF